jgi:nitroreductase
MEVFEAVRTVLAVRRYQDKPVPKELVQRVVEAAWLTGSSQNGQPWHFIVVEDREMLRRLGEAARSGPYIAQAAFSVAVLINDSRFAVSDASRAIQSMVLTAWADGVGSNWVGFGQMDEVKGLLSVPAELDVLAVISFGYPEQRLGRGRKKRRPLSEVVSRERFGQPIAEQ